MISWTRRTAILAAFAIAGLSTPSLRANGDCTSCTVASQPDCCVRCGLKCVPGRLVEKTVMVPITVTETRLKTCIQKVNKEFEETYTVFKREPVTKTIKKRTCYLEDEIRTKMVECKHCARVRNPTVTSFTTEVPEQDVRIGPPPKSPCACGDSGDGTCPCMCASETCADGSCTECAADQSECERVVTVMKKKACSQNGEKQDVIFRKSTKPLSYCVKVPKYKEEICKEITEYELVPVEKTRTVVHCVPEIVKKPVEVQVTKMVCKKILCCEACSKH